MDGFRAWSGAVLLGATVLVLACKSLSDVVFERPTFAPQLDAQGRLRVTFGPGADVMRGFTLDGRLLFRADNLAPFGTGWILASVPPTGGQVREEVGVYRPALKTQMGTLVSDGSQRVLATWMPPIPGYHGCPERTPLLPSPVYVVAYALPAQDGVPIGSVPSRAIWTNAVEISGLGGLDKRVRVTPTLRDVARTGANPFGPVILPGTGDMIYSDGEHILRASIADTSTGPTLLADGAYPALSPDGRSLAYARPVGLDSTQQVFTDTVGLAICVQTQVEITAAGWEVVLRDLESGEDSVLTDGMEPVWDPSAERLVVRGTTLEWFYLSTQTSVPIEATAGAFAPAISPDGHVLAFSLFSQGTNTDVYYLNVN
jgi:hypothetical protein